MQVIGLIFLGIFSSSLVTGEKRQSGVSLEQVLNQLEQLKKESQDLKQEVSELKANPKFPLGFVYVQLPEEKSPTAIWPSMKWTEVSATYAGVFFRVAGGGANDFGTIQEENAPRLTQVEWKNCRDYPVNDCGNIKSASPLYLPSDGTWSDHVLTADRHVGYIDGNDFTKMHKFSNYHRFRQSTGEVRPRNMAVKVWKRTG